MPREIVIVSDEAPNAEVFRAAGRFVLGGVQVRELETGVLQLVHDDDVVLSVAAPRRIEDRVEAVRFAPAAARFTGAVHWTEAWAPWDAAGEFGVRIATRVAAQLGAVCVVADETS